MERDWSRCDHGELPPVQNIPPKYLGVRARRGPLSKSFGFVLPSAVVTVLTGVQPEFLECRFRGGGCGLGRVVGYFTAAGIDSARGCELKRRLTDS